jgi:hypothetical protein
MQDNGKRMREWEESYWYMRLVNAGYIKDIYKMIAGGDFI